MKRNNYLTMIALSTFPNWDLLHLTLLVADGRCVSINTFFSLGLTTKAWTRAQLFTWWGIWRPWSQTKHSPARSLPSEITCTAWRRPKTLSTSTRWTDRWFETRSVSGRTEKGELNKRIYAVIWAEEVSLVVLWQKKLELHVSKDIVFLSLNLSFKSIDPLTHFVGKLPVVWRAPWHTTVAHCILSEPSHSATHLWPCAWWVLINITQQLYVSVLQARLRELPAKNTFLYQRVTGQVFVVHFKKQKALLILKKMIKMCGLEAFYIVRHP